MKVCLNDNSDGEKHDEPHYCQLCWNKISSAADLVEVSFKQLNDSINNGPGGGYRRSLAVQHEVTIENLKRVMHGATPNPFPNVTVDIADWSLRIATLVSQAKSEDDQMSRLWFMLEKFRDAIVRDVLKVPPKVVCKHEAKAVAQGVGDAAAPQCPTCGEVLDGWFCPKSPTGRCTYEKGDNDCCDHCGKPDERK